MAPIYTQYIEDRNAFQLIHEISIQVRAKTSAK